MSDPIRDAAIEAAAKAFHDELCPDAELCIEPETHRRLPELAPLVDAVLAVALPEWRKHAFELRKTAIREARAEALRDWANQLDEQPYHKVVQGDMARWLRDRADEEEGK